MSNEREAFEYEAGKALSLPVSIIEQARNGDRYDHDFDSMSLMQPLNGWWHWWQAGREGMESKLTKAELKVEDLQSQLTALTSQLESVVAENAALKAANEEGCRWDGEQWVGISVETPATSAFLAEVRASSVEMFASHLRTNDNGASVCKMIALGADEFAAQLRQVGAE